MPPSTAKRPILLFGYWPPTDIGVAGRPGMLAAYDPSKNATVGGYQVIAMTPSFSASIGYYPIPNSNPLQSDMNNPYWGHGSDPLQVNYPNTSRDFWAQVAKYNPIAILSFSRGYPKQGTNLGVDWEFERGRNLPLAQWITSQTYINNTGQVLNDPFDPPIPGGDPNDYSPEKNTFIAPGSPPDNNPNRANSAVVLGNLPTAKIISAIQAKYNATQITPYVDSNSTDFAGSFVSEYMAYHVVWYRYYINAKYAKNDLANHECKFSGHTHVGVQLPVNIAADAVAIQLQQVVNLLPK